MFSFHYIKFYLFISGHAALPEASVLAGGPSVGPEEYTLCTLFFSAALTSFTRPDSTSQSLTSIEFFWISVIVSMSLHSRLKYSEHNTSSFERLYNSNVHSITACTAVRASVRVNILCLHHSLMQEFIFSLKINHRPECRTGDCFYTSIIFF